MLIRPATIDDANAIANIHTTSWRRTYTSELTKAYLDNIVPTERSESWLEKLTFPDNNQHIIVAEINNEIVGFACFFANKHAKRGSYLDNLHICHTHQSKGIGRLLLTHGAQWCDSIAPDKGLYLMVNQSNKRAQNFYKSLGASNVDLACWNAPDGSVVPTYLFVWSNLDLLLNDDKF